MSDSIVPKIVNAVVTIQPLASAVTNRDQPGVQNPLAQLASGMLVQGYVINRDRNNNPILRTPQGDLVVQSEVFIKTGSEVTFRVDPSQASRARIVTIDNLSPEEYSAQTAVRNLTHDTIAQSALKFAPDARTAAAQAAPILQAVVLQALATQPQATSGTGSQQAVPTASPSVPQTPVPPALQQLASGTAVTLTLLDVKLPPMPIAMQSIPEPAGLARLLPQPPQPTAPLPPAPQAATPPGTSPLPPTMLLPTAYASPPAPQPVAPGIGYAPQAAYPSPIPATQPLQPSIVTAPAPAPIGAPTANPTPAMPPLPSAPALAPAATTTAPLPNASLPPAPLPAAPAATPAMFHASIIGHGEDGSNILHTPFATLKLFTPQPLPTGTTLTIEAKAESAPAPAANPLLAAFSAVTPRPTLPLPELSYITHAISQLMVSDPTLARELMAQLPTIGPKLTSGLLFFLTAVKQGNLRDLFNPRLGSRLETLAPEMMARLGRDISTWNQNFIESPLNEWKGVPLPLIFNQQAEPAYLYIRKEQDNNKQGGDAAAIGQRFVIDITFSELGPMQFDGFVRHDSIKSLELFLRSQDPLDTQFSEGIRQIFENALGSTGMSGQLVFQHGAERFIKPQARPQTPNEGGTAHTILA